MKPRPILIALSLALFAFPAFASAPKSVMEIQTSFILQIGIVLFVVKLGGMAAQALRLPAMLGELLSGVAIGPYALGGIAIPGFPSGLFASAALGGALPVSPELYGIATIASIILLFESGLETDLSLFFKYSLSGGVVGVGGVLASFALGDALGMAVFGASFMDPGNLFLGLVATATSVGMAARNLSDSKKMDSPEGVTILAAAVFDDVWGIIALAVVMGIAAIGGLGGGVPDAGALGRIVLRAVIMALGFAALGLALAKRLGSLLKRFKQVSAFTVLSLGLALIVAGIFEKEGMAMIIGAYVVGLSLSQTDISHVIIDKIRVLYDFFVPVFFAVMGMLVDPRQFLSPSVLLGGLAFAVLALLAKLMGCGLPALFVGFNLRGAARIGAGMIPRGEVALIIAGIGVASGILDAQGFGMAIMMILISAAIAPTALRLSLSSPLPGAQKKAPAGESLSHEFPFPSEDVALLVTDTMTHQLQAEGFYLRSLGIDAGIAQLRKADMVFSLRLKGKTLTVQASRATMPMVLTSLFEAVAALNNSFGKLKGYFDPASLSAALLPDSGPLPPAEAKVIDRSCILLDLKGATKDAVIQELLDALDRADRIRDRALAEEAIMERERSMSTGMKQGIALPHAKTDGVERLAAAIGIKRDGMDFQSLDGEPTYIIVLSVSPKKHPESHLQFLAGIGSALGDKMRRDDILNARSEDELSLLLGL